MELDTNLVYLVIVAIGATAACFIAKMYLQPSRYEGKMKKKMDEYVAELEDDNKYLTKQINAMKKGAKISESDLENPINAIQALIPQFEHLVPAKFKPFLRDPAIMEYVAKLVQENPDKAKELLSKFVSKSGQNKQLMEGQEPEAV